MNPGIIPCVIPGIVPGIIPDITPCTLPKLQVAQGAQSAQTGHVPQLAQLAQLARNGKLQPVQLSRASVCKPRRRRVPQLSQPAARGSPPLANQTLQKEHRKHGHRKTTRNAEALRNSGDVVDFCLIVALGARVLAGANHDLGSKTARCKICKKSKITH